MLWIFFTNFVANFVKFLRIPTFSLIKTDFFYIFSLSVNGKLSLIRYMAPKLFFETTFIIKTFKSVYLAVKNKCPLTFIQLETLQDIHFMSQYIALLGKCIAKATQAHTHTSHDLHHCKINVQDQKGTASRKHKRYGSKDALHITTTFTSKQHTHK